MYRHVNEHFPCLTLLICSFLDNLFFLSDHADNQYPWTETKSTSHWMRQLCGLSPIFMSAATRRHGGIRGNGYFIRRDEDGKAVALGEPPRSFALTVIHYIPTQMASIITPLGKIFQLLSGSLMEFREMRTPFILFTNVPKVRKKTYLPALRLRPPFFSALWPLTPSLLNIPCGNGRFSGRCVFLNSRIMLVEVISLDVYRAI